MRETKVILNDHAAIDITKLIMAYLVVAIHTEPFGFSFWLDKGFGIITRICVPFFFVASSYFFFQKNGDPVKYIRRLGILYFVWSLIYLPFDLPVLKEMSIGQIVEKYFWIGNGHALWYLCGSIIGFLIVWTLSRKLSPKVVFAITVGLWVIGCLKSTYTPVMENVFSFTFSDRLGSRNGLFYASAYYALGLLIARKDVEYTKPQMKNIVGFTISAFLLCVESLILVYFFKTQQTILWFSVLPLTYNFFMIVKSLQIPISHERAYFCRKLSTLIYVMHCFIMYIFADLQCWKAFIVVAILSTAISTVVFCMSKRKIFRWLKVLF